MLSFRSAVSAIALSCLALPLQAKDDLAIYHGYVENLYGIYEEMAKDAFAGHGVLMVKYGQPLARDIACGRTLQGLKGKGGAIAMAFEGMNVPGLEAANYLDRYGSHEPALAYAKKMCQYTDSYMNQTDQELAFINFDYPKMPASVSEFEYWLGVLIGCQFDPHVNSLGLKLLKSHAEIVSQVGVISEPYMEQKSRETRIPYTPSDPYESPSALLIGLMDAAGDPQCADADAAQQIVGNALRSQQNAVVFLKDQIINN